MFCKPPPIWSFSEITQPRLKLSIGRAPPLLILGNREHAHAHKASGSYLAVSGVITQIYRCADPIIVIQR